jgi:hypothetical protein
MELDVTPQPSPEEEEAIEAALTRLLEPSGEPRSAWWRAGVEESLDPLES